MISILRGTAKTVLFLLWCLLLVPPYLVFYALGNWFRQPMISLWHRGVCWLAGIDIRVTGYPCSRDNVLLVSNHVSYLDIPVLRATSNMTFVAKADVADWPLFGFLARIVQTIFIERNPQRAADQKDALQARLTGGEHLMIFPEGTSTDGKTVKQFKSALFQIAMDDHVRDHCHIQPVTIACRDAIQGQEDLFSWHGDMTLLPHLWTLFCRDGLTVDIFFHAPAPASDFDTRKALCQWAWTTTSRGLEQLQSRNMVASTQNHQTAVIKMQAE